MIIFLNHMAGKNRADNPFSLPENPNTGRFSKKLRIHIGLKASKHGAVFHIMAIENRVAGRKRFRKRICKNYSRYAVLPLKAVVQIKGSVFSPDYRLIHLCFRNMEPKGILWIHHPQHFFIRHSPILFPFLRNAVSICQNDI